MNEPMTPPMNNGWNCPKCNTVNAPWVPYCCVCSKGKHDESTINTTFEQMLNEDLNGI